MSRRSKKRQDPIRSAPPRWRLPASWRWVRADQISEIVGGGTPPSHDDRNFRPAGQGTPWITPADLTHHDSPTIAHGRRDLSPFGLANCGAKVMPAGAVLLSTRAPIGYAVIATKPAATNQGFKSLVLEDDISPHYIRYYLKASTDYLHTIASGTTFPEISGSRAKTMLVALPPLSEQRRIVARLQTLEARSRRAREALAAIPLLLAQARQSLLASAFTGALTEDWRKKHPNLQSGSSLVEILEARHQDAGGHKRGNAATATEGVHDLTPTSFPPTWGLTDLLNLCRPGRPVTYGILMPGPDRPDGVPYVRVADFPISTTGREAGWHFLCCFLVCHAYIGFRSAVSERRLQAVEG